MTDLKLKHVTIRNWAKFRDVKLSFPEKGLVLVQGKNTASGGALLSVGSGKSAFGEAISRTLLGVQGRFVHLKQYSTDKAGDTYVKLEVELRGKSLVVESGYRCKELSTTGDALKYTYDGKVVQRGKIEQTRAELSSLLGVSPLLAKWTAYIDGDSVKFNTLGQENAVELVMSSLRQPPWSAYHEASKKTINLFRRSMAVTETTHQNAVDALQQAADSVADAAARVTQEKADYAEEVRAHAGRTAKIKEAVGELEQKIKKNRLKVALAETDIKTHGKKLKLMEEQRAVANKALEVKMHAIEDAIAAAEEARTPFQTARDDANEKVTEARMAHSNYASASKDCPTCKRPMGKLDPKHLQKLADALAAAKEAATEAGTKWVAAEQKVVDLNIEYRAVSKKQREVSAQSDVENIADAIEDLGREIAGVNREIQDLELEITDHNLEIARQSHGPSNSALISAEDRLADRRDDQKAAQTALETAAVALAADQVTLKTLEYWNLAFSPYGIPNMVLTDAIGPLNTESRRVSAEMTGGTIEVRYSTVKELASGLSKAQLNIEVDNKLGDKELAGSSKGEGGLTNFIISETLSEVGQVSQRVGYRWYDEIVPHQDPKVCHSIYSYMKEIANRLGILVFLVDHNPVAANYADHFLVIEKLGADPDVESTACWR